MKFRYFKLTGESLKLYLAAEKTEMAQVRKRHDGIFALDGLESYRADRQGSIMCLLFAKGKQPDGMIRASKHYPANEVRPRKRGAVGKEVRDLIASLKVTVDCQAVIVKCLALPDYISGASAASRTGMALYTSRVGHIGKDVYAEVPISESAEPSEREVLKEHADLVEMKGSEFLKVHEDNEGHDYKNEVYSLFFDARRKTNQKI